MRKILSLAMIFLIVFNLSIVSASPITPTVAAEELVTLKIYQGYEDGSLKLENKISRAEFATLGVRLMSMEHLEASRRGKTVFKDVSASFWGSGYINIATESALIKGYEDQSFRPQGNITYAEALAILIRVLGYDNTVQGTWPTNYINKANELGISKNVNLQPNHIVNRGEVAMLIYNSLRVPVAKQ